MSLRIALAAALLAAGAAHAASPLGVARSTESFQITRATGFSDAGAMSALVMGGDRIETGDAAVRYQANGGPAMLMDRSTVVAFTEDGAARLEQGQLAVSMPEGSRLAVLTDDLSITPAAEQDGTMPGVPAVAVAAPAEGEVLLSGIAQRFEVRQLPEGNQVAMVGPGDTLQLFRNSVGDWVPRMPSIQTPDGPTPAGPASEEDKELDRRKGGWRWWGTAAAAGAAVAVVGLGYLAVDELVISDDGDKNDDDESEAGRPNVSGIRPPQEEARARALYE
ncbi:MAG: hypothetical protein SF028_05505 [Candidatus Sumerlaeia bacterium]|nr:hypothetical protein [Candidatus Sumerlaeia bacterium]